jgi:hypothetical protein
MPHRLVAASTIEQPAAAELLERDLTHDVLEALPLVDDLDLEPVLVQVDLQLDRAFAVEDGVVDQLAEHELRPVKLFGLQLVTHPLGEQASSLPRSLDGTRKCHAVRQVRNLANGG